MNSFQKIALGALLLSATGCTLIDDSERKDTYVPIGWKATDLPYPVALEFVQGRLIVASGDPGHCGIHVVDTATDTIVNYYRMEKGHLRGDFQLAARKDSLLIASQTVVLTKIDLTTGRRKTLMNLEPSATPTSSTVTPWSSEGRVFIWAKSPYYFTELTAYSPYLQTLRPAYGITGIVTSGGRVVLSEGPTAKLYITSYPNVAAVDTLDLHQLTGDNKGNALAMTSFEGSLFVKMQLESPDSAYVAVVNATTLALEKKIPLVNKAFNTGRGHLRDGIWYLCGLEDRSLNGGGVEAIDLRSRTSLGIKVSNLEVGGNIYDFIPVAPGKGYVTFTVSDSTSGSYHHLRKVSF